MRQQALPEGLYQCTMLCGFTFQNNIHFHSPSSENIISHNTHKGSLLLTYAFIVSSEIGAMKTLVLSVNLALSVPMCRITPVNTVCARPSNLLTNWLQSHTELCENGGFIIMHLYWLLCGQVSHVHSILRTGTNFVFKSLLVKVLQILFYFSSSSSSSSSSLCGISFDQSHDPLSMLFTRPLKKNYHWCQKKRK
jgi:hypothetical protein